jgi:hypothetical protein
MLDVILKAWNDPEILLNAPANDFQVASIESQLGFSFPASIKLFWLAADGFRDNQLAENMIQLWSLERVMYEYQNRTDKNFIGFADFLINSTAYGFFRNKNGIFRDCDSHLPLCQSFEDWVKMVGNDAADLY